jgi:hypothetical protein
MQNTERVRAKGHPNRLIGYSVRKSEYEEEITDEFPSHLELLSKF